MSDSIIIALVHDVFHDADGASRLGRRLAAAKDGGAELAMLPELSLDPWYPAHREARPEAAEEPGGERHRKLSDAARGAGIGVLGTVIVEQPEGRLHRSLLFDASGELAATYDKLHIPCEPGFWESDHYGIAERPPERIDAFSFPLGIQMCSDVNRPQGCHLLGAQGAMAILAPRATEAATFDRWRLVLRANAVTTCAYVLSVARPGPEAGVGLGGPSIVIAPDGEILMESEEPVTVARLERRRVERARRGYPGYLPVRSRIYARGWANVTPDEDGAGR